MAEVVVAVVMAPAADAQQQKRSFAADITNQDTTTGAPKKPKKEPKKKVLFRWSDKDKASKGARNDATILSPACRRAYGVTAPVQKRHAPKSLSPNAAFYEHTGADAVAAVQARRSGAAPSLADGALKKRPLFGGMAHVSKAPAAPANIVGVDERYAAYGALGREVNARDKQAKTAVEKSAGGQFVAGEMRAPQFKLWLSTKEGPEDAPWYTDTQKAAADCKKRWPAETKRGHPDYATSKMTANLVQVMRGKSIKSFRPRERKGLELDHRITKWEFEWKKE